MRVRNEGERVRNEGERVRNEGRRCSPTQSRTKKTKWEGDLNVDLSSGSPNDSADNLKMYRSTHSQISLVMELADFRQDYEEQYIITERGV